MKRIEKPGTYTFPGSCDRAALGIKLRELKTQGHAIKADEVFEHKAKTGEIHVYHYLTCATCAEKRNHG